MLKLLTMWATPSNTNTVRLAVCPMCAALVLAEDYSTHEGWHLALIDRQADQERAHDQ
jgi:hypothetical protein